MNQRRSNQSILKEISPEYSLAGLMVELQNFGHLIRRINSLEKSLMLGKIKGRGRREQQRIRWLDGITNSRNSSKLKSIESVMSSNHFCLSSLLVLPSIFPSIRVFSNESVLRIRWPKYWSFSFIISPSNEHSGLISFRIDLFDLIKSKQHFSTTV